MERVPQEPGIRLTRSVSFSDGQTAETGTSERAECGSVVARRGEHAGPPCSGVVLLVSVEILLSGLLGHLHKLFFGAPTHCGNGTECNGH